MALEESLGYHFQRHELLEQALTHSSQAREVEALGAAGSALGARFAAAAITKISSFWETPCSGS